MLHSFEERCELIFESALPICWTIHEKESLEIILHNIHFGNI